MKAGKSRKNQPKKLKDKSIHCLSTVTFLQAQTQRGQSPNRRLASQNPQAFFYIFRSLLIVTKLA